MNETKKRWTKADFERIAQVLNDLKPEEGCDFNDPASVARHNQWTATVHAFADMCNRYSNFTPNGNRSFDYARFLAWVIA